MLSSPHQKLEDLLILSSSETQVRKYIEDKLSQNPTDPGEISRIINSLQKYPLRLIYALSETSKMINDFMESSEELNKHWANMLETLEYHSHPIESFDGEIYLSRLSQLKGAFLLSELQKNPDLSHHASFAILNKACDMGMYHALVQRMNFYADKIKNRKSKKLDDETIETYVQYLLRDMDKLSNLYWAMGCIDSAITLFSLVDYYFDLPGHKITVERFFMPMAVNKFSWSTSYDSKECPYPIRIIEAALENLYIASLLAQIPESRKISDELSHGKGLLAGYEDIFGSPTELQRHVEKKLSGLEIPLIESLCRNAFEHAKKTIARQHPDYQLQEEFTHLGLGMS